MKKTNFYLVDKSSFLFGGEVEIILRTVAVPEKIIVPFATLFFRPLPLLRLPSSATGGGRLRPSRAGSRRSTYIFSATKKGTHLGAFFRGGEGEI